jgi:hypothetical protein
MNILSFRYSISSEIDENELRNLTSVRRVSITDMPDNNRKVPARISGFLGLSMYFDMPAK